MKDYCPMCHGELVPFDDARGLKACAGCGAVYAFTFVREECEIVLKPVLVGMAEKPRPVLGGYF